MAFLTHTLIWSAASFKAFAAAGDGGIAEMLADSDEAWGRWIEVSCDIWFVNEALERV